MQYSASYFVQIDPWYLWVKTLSWASLKLAINGQWQIFQHVVTYFLSTFSLSSSIAPLTLKCFTNGNSLVFTPFLWNTIVMRKPAIFSEAGEEKEKHRWFSLVRMRGELLQKSVFQIELFQNPLLHLILMPCSHSFITMDPKSHQFYQLKKLTNPNSYSWQVEEHF